MPSKRLLTVAESFWKAGHNPFEGVETKALNVDFQRVTQSKDTLIQRLRQTSYVEVLAGLQNIELMEGDAEFVDEHTIQVNGEHIRGDRFLIATGSSTFIPPIDGLDKVSYLTNIEALSLQEKPESLIILGGGPLGLEFAQYFQRFGTHVTVLEYAEQITGREEPELAQKLKEHLEKEGIVIYTNAKTSHIQASKNGIVEVKFQVEEKKNKITADKFLVATGVKANTEELHLERAGVELSGRGGLQVNNRMETNVPHIFGAGDVVDVVAGEVNPKLETVAGKEGFLAASNALGNESMEMDLDAIPHAIFTDPPLASVGLTDAEAVERGYTCGCRTLPLEIVPKAHILEATDGLIKMVVDQKTEEILGIHMVGAHAAEIISLATLIVKNKMTLNDVIETVFIFPTMSEAIKWVAQAFKKDVSKLSCCTE